MSRLILWDTATSNECYGSTLCADVQRMIWDLLKWDRFYMESLERVARYQSAADFDVPDVRFEAIKSNPTLFWTKQWGNVTQWDRLALVIAEPVNLPMLSSPALLRIAVRSQYTALKYCKPEAQTEELCIEAVTHFASALQFVHNQTHAVCAAAIEKSAYALEFIREPTPELIMQALLANGEVIYFVQDKRPEYCLAAVRSRGTALRHIPDPTDEIIHTALAQDYRVLHLVKNPSPTLFEDALRNNGLAWHGIPSILRTRKLYEIAVAQNPDVPQYRPRKLKQI